MKILFISHDANRAGAQIFLLNIMQYFQKKQVPMHLLLLSDGVLEKDFEQICTVSKYPNEPANISLNFQDKVLKKFGLKDNTPTQKAKEELKAKLLSENFDCIYTNTIATAWIMPELLSYLKVPLITHIHELEFSIQLYSSAENKDFLFKNTSKLIACSQAVADNLIENHGLPHEKVEVIHSFVNNEDVLKRSAKINQLAIREKYGIPEKAFLIGGCGNAEWRKGLDIFSLLAKTILRISNEDIHFAWVGVRKAGEYYEQVLFDASKMGIKEKITFIEPTPEAIELINCFDIFTVVSREDPFPLVMLEAALSQRIIFGFEKTGGCSEFIGQDAGQLFPYLDIHAMALAIINHIKSPNKEWGQRAKEKVLTQYSFENSILKIEKLLDNLS
ncbi:glycosyltransferase family 4 protein [Emticicia sp. C21]|uniref:glycosyltransferase family 4 protein n=1 Tax=Emticicia sp. C21 TaxID=2302915 RepID=UPI000E34BC8B|nr:glycosyltransferase family 4 protein [Emticicia sp. C21]RFS13615.1 glycosyltransferase [Emticicia sp. C21]